ncbi:MAG: response regulator [Gammaproteobacteria bacterium]|nr:response regulator [Gammaproteobacteria bacterium]
MREISILHVDDDDDIRTITQIAFSLHPEIELTQFGSGEEAVSFAATGNADILLLDFMMPGLDGLATLEKLRELPQYKNTPAVFMTAKAEKGMKGILMDAGAASVITKPFDPMTLGDTVIGVLKACSATSQILELDSPARPDSAIQTE